VVLFVLRAQPELLARTATHSPLRGLRLKPVLIGLAVAALVAAGALSWFASTNSDGLEWSIAKVTGSGELESSSQAHDTSADVQERTAFLPDYGFKRREPAAAAAAGAAEEEAAWPAVDPGASVAGVVGALIVLAIAVGIGLVLRKRSASRAAPSA
jgi:cobalt/nickel transport system permease protein